MTRRVWYQNAVACSSHSWPWCCSSCSHEVSGQWFGSHFQIDTQLIFHTGMQQRTRYRPYLCPTAIGRGLGQEVYAVPFVMPLVGTALPVHSLDVARSHASSLSRKMNHSEALYGRHCTWVCRQEVMLQENGLNCTGAASTCQGTAQETGTDHAVWLKRRFRWWMMCGT